jgi:hypothetical protein
LLVKDRGRLGHAGSVVQAVDRAQLAARAVSHRRHGFLVADVNRERQCGAAGVAKAFGRGLGGFPVDIGHRHPRAVRGQPGGDAPSDPVARPDADDGASRDPVVWHRFRHRFQITANGRTGEP